MLSFVNLSLVVSGVVPCMGDGLAKAEHRAEVGPGCLAWFGGTAAAWVDTLVGFGSAVEIAGQVGG